VITSSSVDTARARAISGKLAEFLARVRRQQGYTIDAVARRPGIAIERLREAEVGKTTLRSLELRRLGNALGVPEIVLLAEVTLLNRTCRPRR
jgi:hypothetical protein